MEHLYPLLYCSIVLAVSFLFDSKFGEEPAADGDPEVHKLSGKQRELFDLEESVRQLAREAQKLNHPDTFVEHSKLQRQVLKLEKQRDKLKLEVAEQKEALGGAEEVQHKQVREKFRDIKNNATRNKLLIALVLSFVFDKAAHFSFDADQLFPLGALIGEQQTDHSFVFRPSFLFVFFLVRFSNRLVDAAKFLASHISK